MMIKYVIVTCFPARQSGYEHNIQPRWRCLLFMYS